MWFLRYERETILRTTLKLLVGWRMHMLNQLADTSACTTEQSQMADFASIAQLTMCTR